MNQREVFEEWFNKSHFANSRGGFGDYKSFAFEAWQAAQQAQWQPIETAPRDGTEIVILTDIGESFVAYFGTATKKWHEVFADNIIREQAAHWMPLPPEPQP